jgi:Holliday junction resolvasome RuvABC ATP-dependent DNA helicase subunit
MNNEISTIHNFFKKTIGQQSAISKIVDLWSGHYYDDGHVPPHIVTAPPGLGKTHLLEIIRKIAREVGKTPIFTSSGAELGTRLAFGEFLVQHMDGKPATLIVDEYHESSVGVQNAFRSMIEVTSMRKPREVKFSDDLIFTFDPKIHTVVLGTNRLDLVAAPLRTRLENVELSQYSDDEIEAILVQMLRDYGLEFEYGTLGMVAEANRGNARDIILWGQSIKRRVAQFQRKTVTTEDVYAILKLREILPKGLNKSELSILLALERCGQLQKQELAARIGCCSKEVEAHEKYLWRREFVRNDGKRVLTAKGHEYLGYLRQCGFLAEKSE